MSLDADRIPVIVAVGQAESRDLVLGPLELAEAASRQALGCAAGLAAAIERVTVVNILAHGGVSPASDLVTALGLDVAVARETTTIGGNTPQAMVERAACEIARGKLSATLIVGAEAVRSIRRERVTPAAAPPAPGATPRPAPPAADRASAAPPAADRASAAPPARQAADPVVGFDRQDLSDEERMAGLLIPLHVYPLFESVLAVRAGRTPAQQREFIGRLMAPFTEVAARHPHAWFRHALSARELATITPENRLVAEPYLKTTVAFLGGAQAAALVVTSLAVARSLKLDDGALFVWSAASANDVWYPMARPDLGRSAGLEAAAGAALRAAGVTIDDVTAVDLYSCFPSAVQIAAASLGLSLDDDRPDGSRPLTLTGGLPYFGGPGNNYSSHAIATMFDMFRAGAGAGVAAGGPGPGEAAGGVRGRIGLVTSVGWYLTRHSVGVYGSAAPEAGFFVGDTAAAQGAIDASALPRLTLGEEVAATARVEASTVFYDREGQPVAAPVIATLGDGRRVAAAAGEGEIDHAGGRWLAGASILVEAAAGSRTGARYRLLDLP